MELPDSGTASQDEPLIVPSHGTDNACQTTIELPVVRPNFYFVLDASASMLASMPGAEHQTRYEAATAAIATMLRGVQTRVNFAATVFPAPSEGSCAAGEELFKLRAGDGQGNTSTGPALESLLYRLKRTAPNGGTPISPTLANLHERLAKMAEPTYVFLLTDGAPNCNLEQPCEAEQCILNLEHASFDTGLACDDSFNCCAQDIFPHMCLDEDDTITQLADLADVGVPAYVIGMPGSATYAGVLDRMSDAAGTARTDSERHYYQVDDAQALAQTLVDLSTEILVDCKLPLHAPPSDKADVRVLAGGESIATEDWQWLDEQTVELLGVTCERWQAGELPVVRVQEDCTGSIR